MANGMVMGGRLPGGNGSGNGSGWEVATVKITGLSLTQVPSENQIESGTPCYFEGYVNIPDHLVFQTREFNSRTEFYNACGQSRENVLVASSIIKNNPNQALVGNNAGTPLKYDVVTTGFSGDPAPLLRFTLYIFARFVD